jgi:hypothetical protein
LIDWHSAVIFEPGRAIGRLQKISKIRRRAEREHAHRRAVWPTLSPSSPRSALRLWFTARLPLVHPVPQPAASGTVECSVVPRIEVSSISCAKIACTARYCFAAWRMAHAGAGVASGSGSSHVRGTPPNTLVGFHRTHSSTSHPNAYLRWLRSEVQVSTFYSISTAAHVCPNDPPWLCTST